MREQSAMNEELKSFLQDGLSSYAPACLALSEFRRQVASKLQGVLDEFSDRFEEIGFDVANLKLERAPLDSSNLDENGSDISLKKVQQTVGEFAFYVEWDMTLDRNEQVWVGAWLWLRKAADRELLFNTLRRLHTATTALEQSSNGTCYFTAYVDADNFCRFDEPFRFLVKEWISLLAGTGLSTTWLSSNPSATVEQSGLAS